VSYLVVTTAAIASPPAPTSTMSSAPTVASVEPPTTKSKSPFKFYLSVFVLNPYCNTV